MNAPRFSPCAGLLATLLLAASLAAANRPPPVEADAGQDETGTTVHLASARNALVQAVIFMRNASAAGKGGQVEKARADLDQALAAVTECLVFTRAHPEISRMPPARSPDLAALSTRIGEFNLGHQTKAPNLRAALLALQLTLAELQQTPAGSPGGYRDGTIDAMTRAGDDLMAGIRIAEDSAGGIRLRAEAAK